MRKFLLACGLLGLAASSAMAQTPTGGLQAPAMTPATTVTGTDVFPVYQGSSPAKTATITVLKNYLQTVLPSGSGTPVVFLATAAATNVANAYTIAVTTPTGWANTKNYVVCAYFGTLNTGATTLNVAGVGVLPVQLQTVAGSLALGGGELNGNHCLTINDAATAFLLDGTLAAGPPLVNPTGEVVTPAKWAAQQQYIFTVDNGLAVPAANTLPTGGGIFIQTIGTPLTITPQSTSAINNGQVGGGAAGVAVKFPADHEAVMSTSGVNDVTAYRIPMGAIQYDGFSWLPGMDLAGATAGISGTRVGTPRVVYNIKCKNELLAGAAKTLTFKSQAANGTIAAGTTIGTAAFDMNANLAVEQTITLTPAPFILLADYYWGASVTGTIGIGTSGSGRCTMAFR